MAKSNGTEEGNLAETVNAILADLHEAAKTGAELAGKELSLLAEEVVVYGAIVATGWIVASLILLGIAWKFYAVSKKLSQKLDSLKAGISTEGASKNLNDEISSVKSSLAVTFMVEVWFAAIGGVMLLVNGVSLGKVILAPRLFLLEYTAALIK